MVVVEQAAEGPAGLHERLASAVLAAVSRVGPAQHRDEQIVDRHGGVGVLHEGAQVVEGGPDAPHLRLRARRNEIVDAGRLGRERLSQVSARPLAGQHLDAHGGAEQLVHHRHLLGALLWGEAQRHGLPVGVVAARFHVADKAEQGWRAVGLHAHPRPKVRRVGLFVHLRDKLSGGGLNHFAKGGVVHRTCSLTDRKAVFIASRLWYNIQTPPTGCRVACGQSSRRAGQRTPMRPCVNTPTLTPVAAASTTASAIRWARGRRGAGDAP